MIEYWYCVNTLVSPLVGPLVGPLVVVPPKQK